MKSKLYFLIEYLFNTRPPNFARYGTVILILSVAALIAAMLAFWLNNKLPLVYRKLAKKARKLLIWCSIVTLFLYWVRLERAPYLSMRIWLWLSLMGSAIGLIAVVAIEWKKIPLRREKLRQQLKQKRYLI